MERYAIISTVSSDRFDYRMAADSAGQPRLAQLAIIKVEGKDETGRFTRRVLPDGWAMSAEASAASGILMVDLNGGFTAKEVCADYVALIDEGYAVVAYGAPHHMKLMRGECRRAGMDDRYASTRCIDLMRAMVDVCRIPNVGRKGWKLPKFEEACVALGVECPAVRDAVASARLSLGMFRALCDGRLLPAPHLPGKD